MTFVSSGVDDTPTDDGLCAAFDRCSPALYRYFVVRTRDTHLADDFMQQLWIQAAGSRTVVPAHEMELWLRGIARNLVRAHWRSTARRGPSVSLADPGLAAELGNQLASTALPREQLEREEVRTQLLLAITALPADEQLLLFGYYFEGRPQAQLACMLDLSERAIEGRLYRARTALRHALADLDDEKDETHD
jgi:RNA polymerase sigma-70 factor (ECF subfamily)